MRVLISLSTYLPQVLEALEEMRFRGVRPDEFTYNTAIGAFAKVSSYLLYLFTYLLSIHLPT